MSFVYRKFLHLNFLRTFLLFASKLSRRVISETNQCASYSSQFSASHPRHFPSPPIASSNGTQQWHLTTWHPAMSPDHGTQQWHHVQSVKVCHNHSPPLASSNGSSNGAMAPYHGTQQWHHVQSIASSNGTQQWHLTTWHPAMASMQQWHRTMTPTMASYHRTLPWHPAMAVTAYLLHPAMAPSNGTLPHDAT